MATAPIHTRLMLALTFSTGIADAVGYLGLDRVFTGNMTGNVVILGMAVVGGDDLPVLGPLLALVGFMVGAAVGGRMLKGLPAGWFSRTTGLFAAVTATLLALSVVLFLDRDPTRPVAVTVTTLMAAAMGMQAATARHLAVKDVTTVVVTSTITAVAADSPLGGGAATGWQRRAGAIGAIIVGAAVGALLLHWHPGAGVAAAAITTAIVTLVGETHRRSVVPSADTVG